MNIVRIIIEAVRKHGAIIEAVEGRTIRIHNTECLPSDFLEIITKFKPYLLEQLNQKSVIELVETVTDHGAALEAINASTIRIHQPELIPDSVKARIKTYKTELLDYLNKETQHYTKQSHTAALKQFEYEAIKVFFDRLERHRNNLRKIDKPIENAMIKPREFGQDLTDKFFMTSQEAHDYIEGLMNQQIFNYDCNLKLYILPNHNHESIKPFINN